MQVHIRAKVRAGLIHLCISAGIAAVVASLVWLLWYPGQYSAIAGGRHLLLLIIAVDVVTGPLLTLVVFNPSKGRSELLRDLGLIALLQLGALAYGVHAMYVARPVGLVFEVDRFRAVTANEVMLEELPQALPQYRILPRFGGPQLMGIRPSRSGDERVRALDLSFQGFDTGQRPSYWIPYAETQTEALKRSKPIAELIKHYPAARAAIEADVKSHDLALASARFLPLLTRHGDWVVLLDAQGAPVGFSPYDGFF